MEAHDRTFRQIIDTSIQFVVPTFQRDYKWDQEQWQRLWDDINRVQVENSDSGHFIGSLVQIDTGRTTPALGSWLVIDGQQRLATLTLLVAALRDHIAASPPATGENGLTTELLDELFLKNRHQNGDAKYKLCLRRTDDATLHAFVDSTELAGIEGSASGQVKGAYQFFRERLAATQGDLWDVFNSIASLRIVEVTLKRGVDDPQFVFESLNGTGVDLSQGDMIRNYLLMNLEEDEQNNLYTAYWSKTEDFFRNDDRILRDNAFDAFLGDYIALKRKDGQQIRRNDIYNEFKKARTIIQGTNSLEQLLEDIRRFAGYYAKFLWPEQEASPRLSQALHDTRALGTTPSTLVMQLYSCYDHIKTLDEKEFVQSLGLIESYLIRHAVLGSRSRSYWRIFAGITNVLVEQSPFDSLKAALRQQQWWSFNTDEEFIKALLDHNLYWLGDICKHILDKLENADQKELSPVREYTIEHIMPQSISNSFNWQYMLGTNWRQIHSEWLHRLGNLTLTGYNSQYSNCPFTAKKIMQNGFNESAVRLNLDVKNQSIWTETQMEERGKRLAERALQIWPYP